MKAVTVHQRDENNGKWETTSEQLAQVAGEANWVTFHEGVNPDILTMQGNQRWRYSFSFLFFVSFLPSYSQYLEGFPPDPTSSHPRGKRPHIILQRHPRAHAADLPVRHLVGKERCHVGGNSGFRTPGRRDRLAQVCKAVRRWRHPTGSRKERRVWAGDHQGDDIRWRDLRVQRNGVDAWKRREVDKNSGELQRNGNSVCHSNR